MKKRIKKIKLLKFNRNSDNRGSLTSVEGFNDIPIEIKRVFYLTDITKDRGGHAHIDTDQVIIAINGELNITIFDGFNYYRRKMSNPHEGLYVPRKLFVDMKGFSSDCICLVIKNSNFYIMFYRNSSADILKRPYNYLLKTFII